LRASDTEGRRLYRALVEEGIVGEEKLRDLMSRIFDIAVIDLNQAQVDRAVATTITPRLAHDRLVLPVSEEDGALVLAVADPTDTGAVEEVRRETGKSVTLRLSTLSEILEQIDHHFGPRLIGVLPSGDKLEYFVNQKEVEIGKATHNHIVLADPTVSNTHAVLIVRDGGYSIVDLGSRNGTFVNGERLSTHARTLRHGDTIQLGQTVLTFRNRAETQENITATLSADALEEVRRRAQMIEAAQRGESRNTGERQSAQAGPVVSVNPPADIAPHPLQAEQAVLPVQATPEMVETVDEESKKKKKKKKGTDDRLKAAYIGGLSRIVAQVIAVLLSVGLALYVANRSMRPDKPAIGLSQTSMIFTATTGGANPAPQSLSIVNTGGGTIAWSAASNESWLAVTPTSGTAPSTITVSVNIAGLSPGAYNGAITISASGANNPTVTVPVSLNVSPATAQ
jgi:pSer/pThr/pTyr-binding forkhead associated (FHA) protein